MKSWLVLAVPNPEIKKREVVKKRAAADTLKTILIEQ